MASRQTAERGAGQDATVSAFRLLASRREASVLGRLSEGHCDIRALRDALPGVASPTLYDVVERLVAAGAAQRSTDAAPLAWEITAAGRRLLQIEQLTFALGRRLPAVQHQPCDEWLEIILLRLADPRTILVLRTLCVGGPARPSEIERALAGRLTHRGLHERLDALVANEVLERRMDGRWPRYAIGAHWHALGCLLLLAAQWEWHAGQPANPEVATDLAAFVALVAPLGRMPSGRRGRCLLVVDDPHAIDPGVWVEVRDGRIEAVGVDDGEGWGREGGDERAAAPAAGVVGALAVATPAAWADALLSGRSDELTVRGSRELVGELVSALGEGVVAGLRSLWAGASGSPAPTRRAAPVR